uniref:LYR motif containing 7 n=1 Tax=Sphaeramia orbicularis TaxID=375764 RepID=A0A673BV89_9TELE
MLNIGFSCKSRSYKCLKRFTGQDFLYSKMMTLHYQVSTSLVSHQYCYLLCIKFLNDVLLSVPNNVTCILFLFFFLKAARLKINEEFRKNKNETSEENIKKMIKMGSDVEIVLRETVLQMEHVGEKTLLLRPRESLLLENVPYCDQPRKKS